MEKRNRMVGKIHLPEAIIQHIQSFLTGKEAARTSFVSKSWYSAWLTRPDLDLDQHDFLIRGMYDRERFHEFAKKTIEWYQEKKLKIESFSIFINDFSVAKELIVKAMERGAVELHFESGDPIEKFVLPQEVLESENLVGVSLTGCKIEGKVNWSNLEYLRLCKVCIEGDMISDILSRSSLIEKLALSECKFLVKIQSPDLVTSSTSRVSLKYSLVNLDLFRHIKLLLLEKLNISSSFFSAFSSKFPCLKGLTVRHCFGFIEGIRIDSPSLEEIHFAQKLTLRAKFDVPRIRKFSFVGTKVPSLSLERASRKWESDISIEWIYFRTSWFFKLNKFLGNLRKWESEIITLSLVLGFMREEEAFDFPIDVGLPKPVVECLMIGVSSSISPAVMDALFWSLHPKSIYQIWKRDVAVKDNNELLKLLCKALIQEGNEDICIPNRNASALRHLVGVNVEVLRDSKFEPLPWKMIFDAMELDASVFSRRTIRFNLQWGIQ